MQIENSQQPEAPKELKPLNPVTQELVQNGLTGLGTGTRRLAILITGFCLDKQWIPNEAADLTTKILIMVILGAVEFAMFHFRLRGSKTLQELINYYAGEEVIRPDKWIDAKSVTEVEKLIQAPPPDKAPVTLTLPPN